MRKLLQALSLIFAASTPVFALGGMAVTNLPLDANFAGYATHPNAKTQLGDFDGDGRTDLALVGVASWSFLPVAFSNNDGSFLTTDKPIGDFVDWTTKPNVKILVGDFNGDRKADIALTGPSNWATVPVAFSNGDGTFNVQNRETSFAGWALHAAAKPLVGDYNGDGKADIALLGPAGWPVVPIAFSNGDGTFNVTTQSNSIAPWAASNGAQMLVGDYNADGRADIALTGVSGWGSVPVALSRGDGSFDTVNQALASFPGWASTPGVKIATGDFNRDGRTDIALAGVATWHSVPIAFAKGDGTFNVQNIATSFADSAALPNTRILAGDFNADGRTDLGLAGPSFASTVPLAFSFPIPFGGSNTFLLTNQPISAFGGLASTATPLLGDFNGDGRTDVALPVVASNSTLPVAFSLSWR